MTKYFAIPLLLLVGCSRGSTPQTYQVAGDVQLDGQPLTCGTVVFMSESGRTAKGEINPNGSFKLGTYADDDGALPGRYRVMIIAPDLKTIEGKHASLDRPIPSLVPARYTSTTTSGIEYEVSANNSNVARFALTTNPSP